MLAAMQHGGQPNVTDARQCQGAADAPEPAARSVVGAGFTAAGAARSVAPGAAHFSYDRRRQRRC